MKIRFLMACLIGLVPVLLFSSYPAAAWSKIQAQQKVTASDWSAGDIYGYSAALAPNTAFVGAPGATIAGNISEGAVYVYTRAQGAWTQVQKITPSDGGAYDEFGISVSVSGNKLLIGSAQHGGTGAAYVFERRGGTWTQVQEFTADDAFAFGYAVSLQGRTAVIGAPFVNGSAGAAYVFREVLGGWNQVAELTATDSAAGKWFGQSVAISGTTVMVGAYNAEDSFAPQGAAYVFTKVGGSWSQTQKLAASDGGTGDAFGFALDVSGSTAFISAPYELVGSPGVFNVGAVYVFNKSEGAWAQAQKLAGSDGTAPNLFGNQVALHGDTAVVGVPAASFSSFLSNEGAAYLYTKSGGVWNLEHIYTPTDFAPGEDFGIAIGLSANGFLATTLPDFAGGPGPDAAYIFGAINSSVTGKAP